MAGQVFLMAYLSFYQSRIVSSTCLEFVLEVVFPIVRRNKNECSLKIEYIGKASSLNMMNEIRKEIEAG